MEIEDSSVPYRAFLRSGSYPALSQRVVRSGGVLVRAAGWFALIICAASAGYNTTQRLVTPSAAEPNEQLRASALHSSAAPAALPAQDIEPVRELIEHEVIADTAPNAPRPNALHTGGPASALAARKRPGAIVHPELQPTALGHADPASHGMPSLSEESRAEQIADRVRALDRASQATPTSKLASAIAEADPIEVVLRDNVEHARAAASPTLSDQGANAPRVLAKASVATTPVVVRAEEPQTSANLPLTASAKIDALAVRGPLSAAHVRRSVERVRPTLSDCYADAARRAGRNRFSPVRVQVTIDEAGRVKLTPKVEGAQLPGLGECVSSAMSKLVCQAPDTGTARASITVGFAPQR